jgi:hypothetical protein
MEQKADIINDICTAISSGDKDVALKTIIDQYPFEKYLVSKGKPPKDVMFSVFRRDHFIDRYTGNKLVFIPSLRIISREFPDEFPFDPHGKMTKCHIAFWELIPTLDHLLPLSRGGTNDVGNLITTSMVINSKKAGWGLEDLYWEKPIAINPEEKWDGLVGWFQEYIKSHIDLLNESYFKTWHRIVRNAKSLRNNL